MGNLCKWGGPLDKQWIVDQKKLQLNYAHVLVSLTCGLFNIPGFAGHVSKELVALYPDHSCGLVTGFSSMIPSLTTTFCSQQPHCLLHQDNSITRSLVIRPLLQRRHVQWNETIINWSPVSCRHKAIFEASQIVNEDAYERTNILKLPINTRTWRNDPVANCTHMALPYKRFLMSARILSSAWHQWRFSVCTGIRSCLDSSRSCEHRHFCNLWRYS